MKFHHVIIGAGISGLTLGWHLKKKFKDQTLTILEADHRVGGWIRSHNDQGFLFEQGPRSCRSKGNGLETLRLIEDLDLCEDVISASPAAKKRYIYWDEKLHTIPNSLISFLLSPLMKGVLPALWKEWRVKPSHLDDESIEHFISRRLNRTIAEKLIDPMVSGIYAGDISKLSLRSCFPELHRMEQEHGSLLKGIFRRKRTENHDSPFIQAMQKTPFFSFAQGMETLVSALYDKLKDSVQLSSGAKSLTLSEDAVEVTLHDGRIIKGEHVFLAVPSHVVSQVLKTIDPSISEMVNIPHASVAIVNAGWHQKVLKQEGFGFLVPSSQKQEVLGVVFDSSALAQQNQHDHETRLTVMLGGMLHPEIEQLSEDEMKEKAFRALKRHLNITEKPDAVRVTLTRHSIPQYEVGHEAKVREIEKLLNQISNSRIVLLGNAWKGVSVNDCIAEAKLLSLDF